MREEPTAHRLKVVDPPLMLRGSDRLDAMKDELLRMYQDGAGQGVIAETAGVNVKTAHAWLLRQSVPIRHDCTLRLPEDEIVQLYRDGVSELEIAQRMGLGKSRLAIARILREHGIKRRGRSAAMFLRMAQATPEERCALSAAAHEAVRGSHHSDETRRKMAQSKSKRRGKGEAIMAAALRALGHVVEEQAPIDRYNIDILVGTIAVEPWCSPGNPLDHIPRNRPRTEYLLRHGFATLWVGYSDLDALRGCLDQVIAHFDEMRREHPASRQYRVIRCYSYSHASNGKVHRGTRIPASVRFDCRRIE